MQLPTVEINGLLMAQLLNNTLINIKFEKKLELFLNSLKKWNSIDYYALVRIFNISHKLEIKCCNEKKFVKKKCIQLKNIFNLL